MDKTILSLHKEFEDKLIDLINNAGMPSVVVLDILQKTTEKISHVVYVQTQNEINAIASEKAFEVMTGMNNNTEEKESEANG